MSESKRRTVPVNNVRKLRPVCITSVRHGKMVAFEHQKTHKVKGVQFSFKTPNNISVCLSIGDREYEKAKALYLTLIHPKIAAGNKHIIFSEGELYALYDYFEHLQTSLIFIYTAVEAFANIAIPDDFTYEKVNNKKVKETWGKESIERWLPTTEKICDILPKILDVHAPKQEKFWKDFKKLEDIRNNIIHQKTVMNESNVNSDYLENFFDEDIFNLIRSGLLVIEYFCNNSASAHVYFPLGMGTKEIVPYLVDDINEHFPGVLEQFK
jgi:hypothetical protein